ncbi:MAG: ATP-binding protein [Vicinamibacterales bacterium]
MIANLPSNEAERLALLKSSGILDTPSEPAFDEIAHLAALVAGVPIALVSFVDERRQWFKARVGIDVCETSRDVAFCAHAILNPDTPLIVTDATADPRFRDTALVTGDPFIRFYAGFPLKVPGAMALGTLCVIDRKPRTLTPEQLAALAGLSRRVIREMEVHAALNELQSQRRQLERDIAARETAEAALREAERNLLEHQARLRLALDAAGLGTWRLNVATDRVHWDDNHLRMFGTTREAFGGRFTDFLAFVHPDDRSDLTADGTPTGAPGEPSSTEFRIVRPSGEIRWIHTTGASRTRDDGQSVEWIGVVQDITERRNAEEELRRAKNDAELANLAKGEFLATMSHEIRTPMSAVIGFASLLLDGPLEAEQREHVETIKASGEALLAILNDVLDFSKIEAGKLDVAKEPLPLSRVAHDVVHMLSALAGEKALSLTVGGRTDAWVIGDQSRTRQALLNLVGNALKFTDSGSVAIEVGDTVDGQVRVAVVDTGIGIPLDRQGTLFEKFTQIDQSSTRRFGGTGLGLAITKRLVELMDGRIGVESTPGRGSTFWFTLPRAESVGLAGEAHTVSSVKPGPGCSSRRAISRLASDRPLRILVAEDNVVNQRLARLVLERLGCTVSMASDGRQAVDAIVRGSSETNGGFDLVLMDCQMPDLDGFAATAAIRQWEREHDRRPLPIIALTASALASDAERCMASGMTAYLSKPLSVEALRSTIVEIVSPRRDAIAS